MYLPVLLFLAALLIFVLFMSFRISIEVVADNSGISYTVTGSILKHIKVVEVKSDFNKPKKPKTDKSENIFSRNKILGFIKSAVEKDRGKIFHIEKLSLAGKFSIGDAAADAILYVFFIVLWQFIIIFFSSKFKLEHQNYSLYPDFQNENTELIFQMILRVVILKALLMIINYFFESKRKNKQQN